MKKKTIKLNNVYKLGIKKFIDSGSTSNIYVLKSGQKFKQYTAPIRELSKDYHIYYKLMEKSLYKQVSLNINDVYSFPRKLVLDKNQICGYLSIFEKGETFDNIDEQLSIESLIRMLKKLEEETKNISELGCLIEDIHNNNILVLKDNIKVIDTDFYYFPTDKTSQEILRKNIREIFIEIIHTLLPSLYLSVIWDERTEKIYYSTCKGNTKITDFLEYIISRLHLYTPNQINDIKTLRKQLFIKK